MKRTTSLVKKADFDFALIPVLRNLSALGMSESDIGVVIGYAKRDAKKFLDQLKKDYPDVKNALALGAKIADTELVTTAMEVALGYDYTEEVKEWIFEEVLDDEGEPTGERRKVLNKVRKYKKHQKPDSTMLKMMLLSRLTDQFIESKAAGVGRSPLDDDATDEEIRRFAGAIMNMLPKKLVESTEVVENE